jgi:hypothetical protein
LFNYQQNRIGNTYLSALLCLVNFAIIKMGMAVLLAALLLIVKRNCQQKCRYEESLSCFGLSKWEKSINLALAAVFLAELC